MLILYNMSDILKYGQKIGSDSMAEQPSYLRNLKTESVVQKVIDCLTDGIVSGELKPGDRLPTEPELAATFGVARTSVREATKILSYMGVLESRRAEGTFVSSGFKESMIDPMVYGIILGRGDDFNSLIELREMTEAGIMRLAMKKAGEDGLALIHKRLEEFEAAAAGDNAAEAAFEADDAFHDAVSALCQNELVDKINRVVRMLTYAVRRKTVETMVGSGRARELLDAHWQIYELLRTKNTDGLEDLIRATYFLNIVNN